MSQPARDPRLSAVIQFQIATACLNEAAIHLTDLLRTRPDPPEPDWVRAYTEACSYLVRAHKRYVAHATMLGRRAEPVAEPFIELTNASPEIGVFALR